MSNAEVRRILMIDPFSQDTAVLQAIAHDAQIAALAHELQQQQLQLDDAMQVPVRDVVRAKEPLYAELRLADAGDDALVDAMLAHPVLINRPIVVTALGTKLCRPSEAVLDILPQPQRGAFNKEDGEAVIDAAGNRIR